MRHSGGTELLCLFACVTAIAHTLGNQNPAEVTTKDVPVTFKSTTNLVMVPVVVRDGKGHPVGDLKQEDFQLFDRGKPQVITRFSVDKRDGASTAVPVPKIPEAAEESRPAAAAFVMPDRFVAYLFDDIEIKAGDLDRVRDAAARHMEKSLGQRDRAAVFTTSGQNMLDFTGDRGKLHNALYKLLLPKPIGGGGATCPDLTYLQARRIRDEYDQEARAFGIWETLACLHMSPNSLGAGQIAGILLKAAVGRTMAIKEQQVRINLNTLRDLVRRMSVLPGQRTIVLASPGFLTLDLKIEESEIIDRAIHAHVVINSLDARGLWIDTRDVGKPSPADVRFGGYSIGQYTAYQERSAHELADMQSDILAEVAAGTGGTFFHNNNDFDEGFRRVAGVPEYTYILSFSPQNVKYDGSVHGLKVALTNRGNFTLEARRNYTAPKSISDPIEAAKEEIREAMFSRDELRDLPVELHTEYFKSGANGAKLSVVAHVDLKPLKFRKEEGRNRDDVSVVVGLFDHNAVFIASVQKDVDLRILDGNFERWLTSGISVRNTFDVKPGRYVVRLIVRDAGGQLMAAQNGVVEIP